MKYQVVRRRREVIIAGEKVHYVGGNLARAWAEALRGLSLAEHPWKCVLLIGMGASLIQILARRSLPPPEIVVLEIDPHMVSLQETLFDIPIRYTTYIGDAAHILPSLSIRFDGIFVDAFIEDRVPEHLIGASFVESLYEHMEPEGILLWNALQKSQADEIGRLLMERFRAVRRWRYELHTFWAAALDSGNFHTPF
ncbi:MAG: fused MFS/spermidine synthase [Bacteroidia bacterium]